MRKGRALVRWLLPFGVLFLVAASIWLAREHAALFPAGNVRIDPRVKVENRAVSLNLWDYRLPVFWGETRYETALEEAVAAFSEQYPDIQVTVTLLDWDAGLQPLTEALAKGEPPDVFGSPGPLLRFNTDLQLPIDPYLDASERATIAPWALASAADEEHIWGWPRWFTPDVWLSHAPSLGQLGIDIGQLLQTGWSATDLIAILKARKSRPPAAAVDPDDPDFLAQLFAASGYPTVVGPTGELWWTPGRLEAAAGLVLALREARTVPRDPISTAKKRLPLLRSGGAWTVFPVSPWMVRHVLERAKTDASGRSATARDAVDIALLPVPKLEPGEAPRTGSVSGYVVFRQQPFRGNVRAKAAMLLAAHLSRHMGQWFAQSLGVVPVHPNAVAQWTERGPYPAPVAEGLLKLAAQSRGPVITAPAYEATAQVLSGIQGHLRELWQGKLTPSAFAARVNARLAELGLTVTDRSDLRAAAGVRPD